MANRELQGKHNNVMGTKQIAIINVVNRCIGYGGIAINRIG